MARIRSGTMDGKGKGLRTDRREAGLGSKLGIDATSKWPPETKREWGTKIRMSEDIVDLVTRRWADYGLPGSGTPIWK